MDDIKMYMDNLEEYINDENRVVTYKWLSITLQIPCNTAKRLLYHYLSTKNEDDLHITYLVMGTSTTPDGIKQAQIHVAPSLELEAVKKLLDAVECVHVYSLSKSKLKDQTAALYTADYDCTRENLATATEYGGIECPAATRHSDADIASLKKLATYRPSTPQDTRKAPDPRLVKPTEKPTATDENTDKQTAKASGDKKNKAAKSSLASMFANQNSVKKEPKENGVVKAEKISEENDTKKTANKKTVTDGKKSSISNFFAKGANPRPVKVKEDLSKSPLRRSPRKSSATAVKEEQLISVEEEEEEEEEEKEKVVGPVKQKNSPLKSPKKNKSKGRAKAKPSTQPRRSRILQMDSDSSEEDASENESENECPVPSPPASPALVVLSDDDNEEPAPASEVSQSKKRSDSPHRGKKRKQVDKTYYDEDGYLLTRKEYVYVTDSESEETAPKPPTKKQDRGTTPPPSDKENNSKDNSPKSPSDNKKKKTKKPPAKKTAKASPTKTKQASIMSFFKKK